MAKSIEYGIRGSAKKSVVQTCGSACKTKYGIQGSAKKTNNYGLQNPKSDFELPRIGRGSEE